MENEFKKLIINDDETKERIQNGIEKNRKGDFTVKISNVKNGTKVKINQISHDFKFGANIFMLDEFPDDEKKNGIYREKFAELFNLATLPFYWDATEPEEGKTRYHYDAEKIYRRPSIDRCIKYCKENGITPREHALCYDKFFPKWLSGKSDDEVKKYLEIRMQQVSSKYAKDIPTMELTNEMHIWKEGVTDFYKNPDFMYDCHKLAEKFFPNNDLCSNEWTGVWEKETDHNKWYYNEIKSLIDKNAKIDAIGIQYHMFYRAEEYFNKTRNFYDVKNILSVLDEFSEFNKPIEITEITIPCFTDDKEKEEEQADIIEQLYSTWFSHENVSKIIYWNVVDGYAAFTEAGNMLEGENYFRGGLLRFDMTEKPAYKRLKYLLNEKWHTEKTCEVIDNEISFKGFFGKYEIDLDGKKYVVDLTKNNKTVSINI